VNFDQVKSRVDILMHETMAGKDKYSKLWNVACSFTRSSSCRNRLFIINKQAEEVHLQHADSAG